MTSLDGITIPQTFRVPGIIEYDKATAQQRLLRLWENYQQAEKYGLKFGWVCREWRDKLKSREEGMQKARTRRLPASPQHPEGYL